MRILTFLHDAFGGRGGIAKFNRDLLGALCSHPEVTEVVCLPRVVVDPVGPLPEKLRYWSWTARGNWAYVAGEAAVLTDPQWYDLIICGHVRLLRLMAPLRLRKQTPMGLILHGVDAWEPFGGDKVMQEIHRLDWFLAVSDFTKQKFLGWTGLPPEKGLVVPNTVDLAKFTPGPKNEQLVARYGLAGKRVLMGMARLDTRERYKGFDEVMEAMPDLLTRHPDLVYMICGDGSDKQRLQEKAASLGIGDKVIFTGYVAEEEKVDTYRLADVFLLAGWGEGFGIVLIEAMACAVPSIASNLDASAEAVMDGEFGLVCNPKDPADLKRAIEEALARPKVIPAGLETFGDAAFERRIHDMILGRYLKA
jgi:glycosyltransferase involved in cell wall biosynthesis